MTTFIHTQSGRLINLAHVLEISETRDDGRIRHQIDWTGGESTVVDIVGEPDELCSTVVPAAPGFSVLVKIIGDDAAVVDVYLEPIIAWRIGWAGATPVVVDDMLPRDPLIVYPDGRVVEPFVQSWESVDDWMTEVRAAHAAELETSHPEWSQP